MYQPLNFAKYAETGLKEMEQILKEVGGENEIDELTPENLLRLAHNPDFYTSKYKGPLQALNKALPLLFTSETMYGGPDQQRNDWRDILSMQGLTLIWSRNKQVYRFDPEFMRDLYQTDGLKLYADLIRHLPFQTFYLDFGGMKEFKPFDGMFVHVEVKANDDVLILGHRVSGEIYFTCVAKLGKKERKYDESGMAYYDYTRELLMDKHASQVPLSVEIQKKTGMQCLDNEAFPDIWIFLIQALTYLSSRKPDIEESMTTKKTYRPSTVIRNKFSEIREWEVGVRYGSSVRAMREAVEEPETEAEETDGPQEETKNKETGRNPRKRPRPHARRAHWHHYRTGPGRKTLEVRWLPPTFVGASGSQTPAVVHKVEKPVEKDPGD